MKKSFTALILVFASLFLIAGCGSEKTETKNEEKPSSDQAKTAVVYFSVTGNTKKIAESITEVVPADIYEIVPEEKYTDEDIDYGNDSSRTSREQSDDSARPKIKEKIDLEGYDTVYLGYPIWWGDVPKIVLTFVESGALDGKTVIPFCTSGQTGIEDSVKTLKKYDRITLKDGRRFSSSSGIDEVKEWIKETDR